MYVCGVWGVWGVWSAVAALPPHADPAAGGWHITAAPLAGNGPSGECVGAVGGVVPGWVGCGWYMYVCVVCTCVMCMCVGWCITVAPVVGGGPPGVWVGVARWVARCRERGV